MSYVFFENMYIYIQIFIAMLDPQGKKKGFFKINEIKFFLQLKFLDG